MIITTNTGANKDTHSFCKCGNDYGGDRIIIEDDIFVPILDGEHQCGLDISNFFKNVSQANTQKFKLTTGQSKIISDIDGNGMKFLAISVIDPASPVYWRKKYSTPVDEYVTAILNGSFHIVTSAFTQDRINATLELTLNSDNLFKYITWANLAATPINGIIADTWANADLTWNNYDPLITTNRKLVINNSVVSIPFVIEQDELGNYTGEVIETIQLGTSAVTFTLNFSGEYPNTFVVDSLTMSIDGHLVGDFFITAGTLTADFTTNPLTMIVDYSFTAESGLIEVYDKIVGLMVLTSTDNEPLQAIKLLNRGVNLVNISAMIGS